MKTVSQFLIVLGIILLVPHTTEAQDSGLTDPDKTRAMEYFIEGISYFENEEYELSLDKLTAAHLILSDEPGINYALSDVYLSIGDLTNAAYYGQIAADLDPENKWYHIKLAEIYRQSGRNEMAVEALQTVLEHHPRDLEVLYMLAENYLEFGELEKSNDVLDKILEFRGSTFEIHLQKFQNYNALHQTEKALAELEKMREINPGNIATLHTISQFYLEMGDMEAAENVLMDARDRKPGDPKTLLLLAEIFINNNEWEKMGDTFRQMIEDPLINPSQKMELIRFVYMQQQSNPGNTVLENQTEKLIRAISENEPEFGPAQLIAADYFLQQNNLEQALVTLERATESTPDEADAWSQRMQVLFSLERYEEIIELSADAIEYASDNAFVLFFTGASYMLTERYEEASDWIEEATLAPSRRNFRSIIYGTLGDVKYQLDNWEAAKEAYEMALQLDGNNHTALNNYAYYLSLREERLDEALEMAEKAVSMEPENAAYLDTLGWVYFKMGEYDEALEYIQKSVNTGDASAEVYEHLGDVYEALGEEDNARIWWQKAYEKDPERTYLQEKFD